MRKPNSSCQGRHNRCKASAARAEERAKRSAKQQLKHLDELLGKGMGAVKERKRLAEAAKAESKPKKAKKETPEASSV